MEKPVGEILYERVCNVQKDVEDVMFKIVMKINKNDASTPDEMNDWWNRLQQIHMKLNGLR